MCVREVCQIRQSMNSRYQISPGYRQVSVWNEVCKAAWEKHVTCSSYISKLYRSNEAQAVSQSHWQLVTGHWSWQTSVFPWRFIQEKSWKPSEAKLVCWGISHLFSGPRFLLALIHLNPFNNHLLQVVVTSLWEESTLEGLRFASLHGTRDGLETGLWL